MGLEASEEAGEAVSAEERGAFSKALLLLVREVGGWATSEAAVGVARGVPADQAAFQRMGGGGAVLNAKCRKQVYTIALQGKQACSRAGERELEPLEFIRVAVAMAELIPGARLEPANGRNETPGEKRISMRCLLGSCTSSLYYDELSLGSMTKPCAHLLGIFIHPENNKSQVVKLRHLLNELLGLGG